MFVKPYCLIPGSFPNLLVYLPRKQGVKKAQGILTERGKVIHPLGSGRFACVRMCAFICAIILKGFPSVGFRFSHWMRFM